ncbi:MAG: insulinase family protein [Kofleriaceae bacterium]|nr:insulinase family protein [Kofleriaceae bacterium]
MKLAKTSLFSLLLAFGCGGSSTPAESTGRTINSLVDEAVVEAALPIDPDIRVGKLENGLTYYIKQHHKPEARASLRLAINAGSVLEDEDQRGLAHFLEHMAFNGTKHFEKMAIVNYLESIGMSFGADVNAYTSFDETVYMLQVPTDSKETLAKGLDILHEWSYAITLDPEEVEKERGVVIEEWRLGRGASERIFDKQFPLMFKGSKYAERLPIGKKEILETAPVSALRRFYEEWYRPDLMVVVAVGDFDPDEMEAMIKERFSTLKNPAGNVRERKPVTVPTHSETIVSIETDPEMTRTSVQIINKMPHRPEITKSDYRRNIAESLYHSMLNERFREIGQTPKSPFMFAASSTGGWARSTDQFSLWAMAKQGRVQDVIDVLVTEVERVNQHGFTATELERAKAGVLRGFQQSVLEHEKTDSSQFAAEILRNFLEQEMMPGIAHELRIAEEVLPTYTLEELNRMAREWTSKENRVVLVSGPAKAKMPTQAAVLAKVDSVVGKTLKPYKDVVVDGPLMDGKPKAGTITKIEKVDAIGVTVWTLSNGARVILKPTEFKNDTILMSGFSPGGHSLVGDKDYPSARFASSIVANGGIGKHSEVALTKLLSGKIASARVGIGELEESVSGRASAADLETMFQLLHLRFTAPRKDKADFAAWKANQQEWVRNRKLNPESVFFDEVSAMAAGNHMRYLPATLEMLENISQDKAFEIYKERFADAGDFTFVFVGNIDEAKFRPLIETYVASLPATGRNEKWKDIGVKRPKGLKKIRTKAGTEPKSFVYLTMHGDEKWSWEKQDDLEMLSQVLRIRLREVLREDMGGVYGVFSGGGISRRPKQRYAFQIGFGCAPANADKLKKAVFQVVAEIKKKGASKEIITKLKEKRRRSYQTDSKENYWWLRGLQNHYRYGTDPTKLLEIDKSVERVSSKRVQAAAKKFLNTKRMIDALLLPVDGTPME